MVATSETASELNWFLDTPMGLIGIVLVAAVAFLIMPLEARAADGGAHRESIGVAHQESVQVALRGPVDTGIGHLPGRQRAGPAP